MAYEIGTFRGGQLLSVAVPCFNEEAALPHTHQRLIGALEAIGLDFEIVYVDDGSTDHTAEILRVLQADDRRVRVIRFSRNFGHQVAVTAALEHASGDAVVVIDADLQDPPEVIGEMVDRWREGYHVVHAQRHERRGESRFKLWTAKTFYRLMRLLADIDMPLDTGDFRLIDRQVVAALNNMPERDRFVRGMVTWVGFRQTEVTYSREPRIAGTSKYPLWKMVRFAADGIFSFSLVPLRLATAMGFVTSALALMGIVYALVMRLFTSIWVSGWTLLFIAVLFVGGVQLVSLGILGEYMGRIYRESKRRPLYVAQERLGFEHAPQARAVPDAVLRPAREWPRGTAVV